MTVSTMKSQPAVVIQERIALKYNIGGMIKSAQIGNSTERWYDNVIMRLHGCKVTTQKSFMSI